MQRAEISKRTSVLSGGRLLNLDDYAHEIPASAATMMQLPKHFLAFYNRRMDEGLMPTELAVRVLVNDARRNQATFSKRVGFPDL